jgi:transcriptional regulator with XRE-family HTH domain
MKLVETICAALKYLRKLKGKSQDEVYFETRISVCQYEINKRQPTIENLNTLCDYYNIKIDKLLQLAKAAVLTNIPVEELIDDMNH